VSKQTLAKIRKGAGELAIITISILLAFSLDAWWGNQKEENARRSMLVTIRGELVISAEEIARARTIHEGLRLKLNAWADIVGPDYQGPMTDSLLAKLFPVRIPSTDVPGAMIAEFQSSYGVGALQDPILVAQFSSWPARVQDYEKGEGNLSNVLVVFKNQIQDSAPSIAELYPTLSGERDSKFESDWQDLMTDFRFENAIFNALFLLDIVIDSNQALEAAAADLMVRIDQYLD